MTNTELVGVILAAGRGSRMVAETWPKPLLPICNKPMIQYQIEVLFSRVPVPCRLAAWILWHYRRQSQESHARLADRIRLPLRYEVRSHSKARAWTGQVTTPGGA